ncbi:MAG: hypothetical protein K2R93_05150 [Gemmatimonadaceae bacterium]|nr:hypothetical protein [Gemmatimonadaceae bacterium]
MTRPLQVTGTLGTARRHLRTLTAATALLVAPPVALHAQGSLSTLGFGYPVGGMSTRVSGTAGAFGEVDALTPANPSALGGITRTVLSAQAEPERRTLRIGSVKETTSAQRIPLLSVIFPAGHGVAVGLSASSVLDRSYTINTTGRVLFDKDTLTTTDRLNVRGAIGKLTAGAGWQVNPRLKLGLAGHLFTGDNLVSRKQKFSDTLSFGSVTDTSQVTYFGTALTAGADVRLVKGLAATMSYRTSGGLDARVRDTVRASANVPSALGASLRYDGIPGTQFVVAMEQVAWSKMRGIGSSLTTTHDATNLRVGVETAGPKWRGLPLFVRAGFARNQLPFSINAEQVKESRWSTGLGIPLAREFGTIDFSLQRATRSLTGTTARESAWLFGVGLQVRPGG